MSEILDLPAIADGLPSVPPAELDPFLDAAARCFSRHGIARTSVPDVAREMGVSRTTVYRQVGTIERLGSLLFAREIHRLLVAIPTYVGDSAPADAIVKTATLVARYAREHPVLRKVLADEPELAGSYLTVGLPAVLDRVAPVLRPLLAAGVASGDVARRDLEVVVDWLVRLVTSVVLVPPAGEMDAYFDVVMRPVLAPSTASEGTT